MLTGSDFVQDISVNSAILDSRKFVRNDWTQYSAVIHYLWITVQSEICVVSRFPL